MQSPARPAAPAPAPAASQKLESAPPPPAGAGIILFGHGARDPRWAEPMQRLATLVRAARRGLPAQAAPVSLAFLELMQPDLPAAVAEMAAAGCTAITIVPVFLGQGGHVRRDLPAVIEQCRTAWPTVEIRCTEAIGENADVLAAMARFCVEQTG